MTFDSNSISFTASFVVRLTLAAATLALPLHADDAPKSETQTVSDRPIDFATDIQPILTARCVGCHGVKKREAGLRLDSGAALLRGSDNGPIVDREDGKQSRLLVAVRGGTDEISRMPPEGAALSEVEIARIERWLDQGAIVPEEKIARAAADHWSFRPPVRPALPNVEHASGCLSPIDRFIVARLEANRLNLSPAADRAMLIRRLSLDLLGLPPTPDEVAAFVADDRPDAYEQLVDRLLASPAYGERWGRHWLDAARYADSNGYTRDFGRQIWKYRDWVIAAINHDLPFDQFTIEQFAGDLLPHATLDQQIATGFHRNTLINEEGGTDQEQFRVDAVADRIATTGEVYLGLTLLCARCHSHKYDPISQREFYQLFAFLNNCDEPTIEAPYQWQVAAGELQRREKIRAQIAALEAEVEKQRPELEAQQQAWEKTVTPQQRARLPGPVQVAYDMPFEKRDAANKKTIEDYFRMTDEAHREFPLLKTIADLRASEPVIPTTLVMKERDEPRPTHVHRRGDFLDLGEEVTPQVLEILHPLAAANSKPNRLDFARWLVDPANPLTPRVIVNRFWQQFFGTGIVETDNDFGTQGAPPTHPELLDWLAVEFVESGWSVKRIHRLIVTSATYRQSSLRRQSRSPSASPAAGGVVSTTIVRDPAAVDPENKLLWRQNRIRLEAEIIRDVALAASGLLTHRIGGPSVFPPQPDGVFEFTQDPKPWIVAEGADRYRRGMYTHFWRSSPYPALMVFDAPNGNISCTRRLRSNTPLQALTLANDVQFMECAEALAIRVLESSAADDATRAEFAFHICLARQPEPLERERLQAFVAEQLAGGEASESAATAGEETSREKPAATATQNETLRGWTAICRALLNLDEFITRE